MTEKLQVSDHVFEENPELADILTCERKPVAVRMAGNVKQSSKGEEKFLSLWASLGGPQLTREYRFHSKRRWRFDFALVSRKIAIEIEGGIWTRGRHTRGQGFINDCHKYNTAVMDGWSIYRFATGMIKAEFVQPIIESVE